jgi:KTSC domain
MKRQEVESSQIKSIGHNGASTLEVEFHGKGDKTSVYQYKEVPASVFNQIISADSIGKAFIALVKKNPEYNHNKL